jgi:hypothetical protein
MAPGVIHQYVTHRLSGNGEKVGPVLPPDVFLADKT